MAKLVDSKKAQQKDVKKAQKIIAQYNKDGISRKTKKLGFRVLDCGLHMRLLSTDEGKTFVLMTHELYNKAVVQTPATVNNSTFKKRA